MLNDHFSGNNYDLLHFFHAIIKCPCVYVQYAYDFNAIIFGILWKFEPLLDCFWRIIVKFTCFIDGGAAGKSPVRRNEHFFASGSMSFKFTSFA